MQRRGITVLVGAIVAALLWVGLQAAAVPYVVLDPGPTVDTLGEYQDTVVISVDGTDTSESAGELRLTTVEVHSDITFLDAIRAWLDAGKAVVPRETVLPSGQTREEVDQHNAEQLTRSQHNAEIAALRYLGYPSRIVVVDVVEDAPATGRLAEGDVITAVAGIKITEPATLQEEIAARPAGTMLTVDYLRAGEPGTAEVTTRPDEDGVPRLGVVVSQEIDAPFELTIELERIGGPSAGLMFALGIVDKLVPEDLTGGEIIAGTGSIDQHGEVGPIGGIPQKLIGARDAGASAFLVPAGNCSEALASAPDGLTLIKVETLPGALAELAALREGEQPTACGA